MEAALSLLLIQGVHLSTLEDLQWQERVRSRVAEPEAFFLEMVGLQYWDLRPEEIELQVEACTLKDWDLLRPAVDLLGILPELHPEGIDLRELLLQAVFLCLELPLYPHRGVVSFRDSGRPLL